ncbi:MAG: NYN domain-containing protein, partial [Deltaproteobacteria bacterium]|nr:NYN domain-containing protein [Deltaproteobacteria bacterium]
MKASPSVRIATAHDQPRLAVLIDSDNAQASLVGPLLAEIARFGLASVKRAYGDWTSQQMSSWKKTLLAHSIAPVQQFAYTTGKNATDSALIIDAMDLMYSGQFHGFCLVSSDSDFTRLAQRLREEGLIVYGFGERKTPEAFVAACDKFVYTEVLRAEPPTAKAAAVAAAPQAASAGASASAASVPKAKDPAPELPREHFNQAVEQAADETGWADLGAVGTYLLKVQPDFDPRHYGAKKLRD